MEASGIQGIPFEPDVVTELMGRPPTDFRAWANEHAAVFKLAE